MQRAQESSDEPLTSGPGESCKSCHRLRRAPGAFSLPSPGPLQLVRGEVIDVLDCLCLRSNTCTNDFRMARSQCWPTASTWQAEPLFCMLGFPPQTKNTDGSFAIVYRSEQGQNMLRRARKSLRNHSKTKDSTCTHVGETQTQSHQHLVRAHEPKETTC